MVLSTISVSMYWKLLKTLSVNCSKNSLLPFLSNASFSNLVLTRWKIFSGGFKSCDRLGKRWSSASILCRASMAFLLVWLGSWQRFFYFELLVLPSRKWYWNVVIWTTQRKNYSTSQKDGTTRYFYQKLLLPFGEVFFHQPTLWCLLLWHLIFYPCADDFDMPDLRYIR